MFARYCTFTLVLVCSGGLLSVGAMAGPPEPGSVLLFPLLDTTDAVLNIVTITNVENDPVVFDVQPRINVGSAEVDANGLLTVTPQSGITGTMEVLVSVSPVSPSDTQDSSDTQVVVIEVS